MSSDRRGLWDELNTAREAMWKASARYEKALRAVEAALLESELEKSPLRRQGESHERP